jgi:hypothetical protein
MIPGSANPLLLASAAAAPAGYAISRSVRLNSADSAYLSREPASTGNRKTWTWAGWVKRTNLGGALYQVFIARSTDATRTGFGIYQDKLYVFFNDTTNWRGQGVASLRDTAAWYHMVMAVDTTQATESNRIKIWVNNQLQTISTVSGALPSQNTDGGVNNTIAHAIGVDGDNTAYPLDGYLADVHFIDGQALDPTSFGEFDTNGIWQPKAYTGTYPGNSFHLTFSDNSTAGSLGDDSSGNGNDWTVNNISVAAGAGNDSVVDVPTNGTETDTGLGGQVRGNYCTWNPLSRIYSGTAVFSNGNLDIAESSSAARPYVGTIAVTGGKFYWEVVKTAGVTTDNGVGILPSTITTQITIYDSSVFVYRGTGEKYVSGSSTSYGAAWGVSDVIGVALDMDAGQITFYKNGVSQGVITGVSTSTTWLPFCGDDVSATNTSWTANFGQRPFAYPVSGYKSLCTANLPAPVITKPSEYMDVVTYTGNGSTQTISGLEFSPDLVWIKNRAQADNHKLLDTVRGATEELESNTTDGEVTNADGLTAFNSNGFDLGADAEYNTNTEAYVAWTWDAGSSTVTNTDGSITSSARANPSAGFSIVTYTGNGTGGATVGHGLGVAPGMIFIKARTLGQWFGVYHSALGATKYLNLGTTSAAGTDGRYFNTTPSSSVFYLGVDAENNQNAATYVAYCFAPVEGYSAFGSYTGNGSADGPFVFTNMRPRWILIKRTDTTGNWTIIDTAREGYNVDNDPLFPNTSGAETTTDLADILSNGFKLRSTDVSANASAGTYIYAAFAESPFQYARAR